MNFKDPAFRLSLIIMLFGFSVRGLSKDGDSTPLVAFIEFRSTSELKPFCESFRNNLVAIIKNEKRFSPVSSGPGKIHLLIRCVSGKLTGQLFVNEDEEELLAASYSAQIADTQLYKQVSTASDFWLKVLAQLPWTAEIFSLESASAASNAPTNTGNLKLRAKGQAAIGLSSNGVVGDCQVIEVGEVVKGKTEGTVEFQPTFTGILRGVETTLSRFEIYSKEDDVDSEKLYVLRPAAPGTQPKGMSEIIKYCRSHPNTPTKVQDLFSNVFGKDAIEVNNVQQRYGLAIATLKGGNGTNVKFMAAGYIHNRLLFGQVLMIDGFGIRSVYTKPYSGFPSNEPVDPPEATVGELFINARGRYHKIKMNLGVGLILEKMNVPYVAVEETATSTASHGVRFSSARGAIMLGANYGGERFSYSLRVPIAQTNRKLYVNFHNYITYRVSSTWLTGIDAMVISSNAKIPDAPNATIYALGGFVGIEIGR